MEVCSCPNPKHGYYEEGYSYIRHSYGDILLYIMCICGIWEAMASWTGTRSCRSALGYIEARKGLVQIPAGRGEEVPI
jgi:hypothetical protein